MPDQNLNPEEKFKQMKKGNSGGVSLSEKNKKEVIKDAEIPFTDGKEATVSEKFVDNIKVDIRNRKEQFFDGEAKTVSSINDTGEFDVLPKHANFVTLIRGYVIVDKGLPSEKKFNVDNGVLAAKTGAVDVYLDF